MKNTFSKLVSFMVMFAIVLIISGRILVPTLVLADDHESQGAITVINTVINDNGGTLTKNDFTLSVQGHNVTSDEKNYFEPGNYLVYEIPLSGYDRSYISCDNHGIITNDVAVNLHAGDNVICNVTNNDQPPSLILNDIVSSGGATPSEWTLTATGPTTLSGTGSNTGVKSDSLFKAGVYSLSESGNVANYTNGTDWDCSGANIGNSITLKPGQETTCTITNTYSPVQTGTLVVKKVVVGSHADPSNFSFKIGDSEPVHFIANSANSGENDISENVGAYSVTEVTTPHFDTSYSNSSNENNNCNNLEVTNGGTITCTITNTLRIPPSNPKVIVLPWSNAPSSVIAGTSINYNLNWQGGPMDNDWEIFVHFVKDDGSYEFNASDDFYPTTPTSQWSESTTTNNSTLIPVNVPAGTYKVMTGMYHGPIRVRLLEAGTGVSEDEQFRFQVGTITIGAPSNSCQSEQGVFHTITASAGPHGTITPSGSVQVLDGGGQSFVITPDDGYKIDSVVRGNLPVIHNDQSYGFTCVKTDDSINVTFAPIVTPPPTPAFDLGLTKTVSDNTVTKNQQITYTLVAQNYGPDTAPAVSVNEVLPAGLQYVSTVSTTQGSYNSGTGTWTIGSLANNTTATLKLKVKVTATSGTITNTASVTGDQGVEGSHANTSSVAITVSSGGGNGDHGGSRGGGSSNSNGIAPVGQVLGAETQICSAVDSYMRVGYKNDPVQVKILQNFLNSYMHAGLIVDGNYGQKTADAVGAFQEAHKDKILTPWGLTKATNIFYKTSLAEAKRLMCPDTFGTLPVPTDLTNWAN